MNNKIVYSIIIPHKNTPELLQRCLDSIPIRDIIQVIVVDDNSDSSVVDFHHFPGIDSSNTEIFFTKEGKGAGYARNIGLTHAKGEWIIFADSDDFFYENAFDVFDKFSDSTYDTIYFNCNSRDGKTMEIVEDRLAIIRDSINNKDLDSLKYRSQVPWGKMIKRKVIEKNHLLFEEIEVSNDVMFSLKLGMLIDTVGIIPEDLYCCTRNEESLFYKKNINRMKVRIKAYKRANNYLYENNLNSFRYPFPRKFITYFLPNHPGLFLWSLWTCRYKGATKEYIIDICALAKNSIGYRVKNHLPFKV